jgi:hypothetical protein
METPFWIYDAPVVPRQKTRSSLCVLVPTTSAEMEMQSR